MEKKSIYITYFITCELLYFEKVLELILKEEITFIIL